jgi:hypothetical protein
METALSYLNALPSTKSEIEDFCNRIQLEIDDQDVLPVLAQLTALSEVVDILKTNLKDRIIDEASRYTGEGKSFAIAGVRYELKSRRTHKFDHCAAYREAKDRIKRLEDLMKTLDKPMADTDTGEIIEPAHSFTTEYVAVTLKK